MSNEMTCGHRVQNYNADGWDDEASDRSGNAIRGKLLKFADWRWTVGKENNVVPEGTRLVAASTARAWVFWQGGRPDKYEFVPPGRKAPDRDELSHRDEDDAWEVGPDARPRDPWQFTRFVYLIDAETADAYTFTTSSFGGAQCVGDLAETIQRMRYAHPTAVPVIELAARPMPTKFGQKSAPVLRVVGWQSLGTDQKRVDAAPAPARIAAPYSDGDHGSPSRKNVQDRPDLDDSIPF